MSEEIKILREAIGFEKIKNGKLKEILREKINKIEFKIIKDSVLGVLYMVCEFSRDGILTARGISVRSLLDIFNKKKGKNKAFGRAVKALLSKSSSEPVRKNITSEVSISRSMKIKDEKTRDYFRTISTYLDKCVITGEVIHYKVNPFLPLKLVSEVVEIEYKSEFMPNPTEFGGLHES